MESYLSNAIDAAVRNFDYETSSFLGEQLLAFLSDSRGSASYENAVLKVARCHYVSGQITRAYETAKQIAATSLEARYIMAQCWYVFDFIAVSCASAYFLQCRLDSYVS